jgi:hypothetical protein
MLQIYDIANVMQDLVHVGFNSLYIRWILLGITYGYLKILGENFFKYSCNACLPAGKIEVKCVL